MRTTKVLRERLERAAGESGRSLAQEVEHIVEWHFNYDMWFKHEMSVEADRAIRPLKAFFALLEANAGDWKHKAPIANALRESIALIGEAAFSKGPISAKRQQAFLDPFWNARDRVPAEIALGALIVAQRFGLAEKFTPQPAKKSAAKKEITR